MWPGREFPKHSACLEETPIVRCVRNVRGRLFFLNEMSALFETVSDKLIKKILNVFLIINQAKLPFKENN